MPDLCRVVRVRAYGNGNVKCDRDSVASSRLAAGFGVAEIVAFVWIQFNPYDRGGPHIMWDDFSHVKPSKGLEALQSPLIDRCPTLDVGLVR